MQVIQSRSPKQNGCIELCQRIWRKELYEASSVAATLDEYRRDARRFVVHHHHVRLHAAPSGRMPIGCLRKHHGESLRCNLTATDPSGKPTPARPVRNARCSDCVQALACLTEFTILDCVTLARNCPKATSHAIFQHGRLCGSRFLFKINSADDDADIEIGLRIYEPAH